MSEEIHDQVSAFLDDELSGEECAFLVRRLGCDPNARGKLARFALIGTVVRDELVLPEPDVLRRRIQQALHDGAATPSTVRVRSAAPQRGVARYRVPAISVGVAAAVALVAIVFVHTESRAPTATQSGALPTMALAATHTDAVAATPVAAAANVTAAAVLTQPAADAQSESLQDWAGQGGLASRQVPFVLTSYLVHHGEYTSMLNRAWVYSTVVGGFAQAGAGNVPAHNAAPSTAAPLGVSVQQISQELP